MSESWKQDCEPCHFVSGSLVSVMSWTRLVTVPFNPFTAPTCKISGLKSAHISGMGIVHKNSNFCGSETHSAQRKNCPWEKQIGANKKKKKEKKKRKKEAPVLVLHWIPAKHMECVHMWLSPVIVFNCEHCRWLSLSREGIRLECSHSYMLLCSECSESLKIKDLPWWSLKL